jgi:hypothetical protein
MIIKVLEYKYSDGSPSYRYFNVNETEDKDKARRIAFRFLKKRKEKDFNELVHETSVVVPENISDDSAKILLSHM